MKNKLLKKAVAFVTAAVMAFGLVTGMPEGVLPQLGVEVSAESSYENFSNIPCGEYARSASQTAFRK